MDGTLTRRLLTSAMVLFVGFTGPVMAGEDMNPAEMAKALAQAPVALEQGLKASKAKGTPISAKYEIEKGALQLSVYTMNNDRYSEVIVDRRTGAVEKSETITEGGDLKAAGTQGAAVSRAKTTLEAAVARAVKANDGYRAVSVEPELAQGTPVAVIVLMKGQDVKKVTEKLD